MDHQQKLVEYISSQLQQGQAPDTISRQLVEAGWPEDQVKQAFLTVQASVVPTHMQESNISASGSEGFPRPQANGSRWGRFKVGWRIFKHSFKLLNDNRYLLRYFVMTWSMVILFNAILITVFWFIAPPDFLDSNAVYYPILFLAYVIVYCVVNFYGAALSRNIMDIYNGERRTYTEYLSAARAKFWPILIYSVFSAIIGIILEYVIEKLGKIGQLIAWLIGSAWSLSTMFVLPIIMDTSQTSAPAAVKQSFKLFKQTWGEGITAKASAAAPIAILQILLWVAFVALFFPVLYVGSMTFIYVYIFIYLFLMISLAVMGSFASNVLSVALYHYATKNRIPPGFDADMLNQVFVKSKRQLKKEANAI